MKRSVTVLSALVLVFGVVVGLALALVGEGLTVGGPGTGTARICECLPSLPTSSRRALAAATDSPCGWVGSSARATSCPGRS